MKRTYTLILIVILVGLGIFLLFRFVQLEPSVSPTDIPPAEVDTEETVLGVDATPKPKPIVAEASPEKSFEEFVLSSTNPGAELVKKVGLVNAHIVFAINRVDDRHLSQGATLSVPLSFEDPGLWEFMPPEVDVAQDIPKLVILSQRTQAFGFYENGKLVRSGPISSGKQSTPTASGLYFTNWKGKEVTSTVNDDWILKWNFNIDNKRGISIHQYSLPGYPASHSCVRLYAQDAHWLYGWAEQWALNPSGTEEITKGTPVIIYGSYDFDQPAPWKQLIDDSEAVKVSEKELAQVVSDNLAEIQNQNSGTMEQ